MQKYDSYKDSCVPWIGFTPSNWDVVEVSHFTTSKSGGTPDRNKKDYWEGGTIPWMSSGEINKGEIFDTNECITSLGLEMSSAKMMSPNTVMIALNGQGKTKGMSAILRIESSCNQSLCGFKCDEKNLNYKHLYYCFQAMYKYLRSQAGDDTREGLAASDIRKERIPLPPYKEQLAMANYLDTKCFKIDNLILTNEKRIKLLKELKQSILTHIVTRGINPNVKMKESGDVWIGQIPEHWDFVPLKRVATVILGKMLQSDSLHDSDSLEKYICAKDVHFGGIDTSDLKFMYFSPFEKKLYQVKKGDMLIVEGGAGAGGCSVVSEDIQDTYIQNSIMIIRGYIDCLDNRYVCNYFTSIAKRGYIDMVTNVATIPHFSKEKVQSTVIPLPPIEEQIEIADYLFYKVSRIEKSIEVALHRIKLLKEYKQSLITEVVTGKRKVV